MTERLARISCRMSECGRGWFWGSLAHSLCLWTFRTRTSIPLRESSRLGRHAGGPPLRSVVVLLTALKHGGELGLELAVARAEPRGLPTLHR